MKVIAVKTKKVVKGDDLFSIFDKSIKSLKEGSVVAITSKIVSISQGRLAKINGENKDELIKKEAEYYLPRSSSKYNFILTIKNGVLIPSSGIDESNGNGFYILWPKNPQDTVNKVREYLKANFNLKKIGVIMVDSKTTPLRWGVTGVSIAHSGFQTLNDYIGKPDIFGRLFTVEKSNIADSLAVSAVLAMGEGAEQTPIAVIEDVAFVNFQDRNPTKKELKALKIEIDDDLYAPLLKGVVWRKGGSK